MSEWLLDTLIVTTALMLLVLAIRRPVAQAFGAQVAYMLWLIPGARMLMPVLTETIERPAPALGAMPDIAASPSAALMASAQAPAEPIMPPLASEAAASPGIMEAQIAAIGGTPGLLLLAWGLGAVGFFAGRLFLYRRERADIMGGAERLAELGKIQLVRSPAVSGPVAFGILDKVIALPIDFDENYTTREQELALDHELAHHRAGDLIANLAAFAMLSVHWFNPVAWAAWRAFRFDQEAACDARVIGNITSGDRVTYGRAIAKAASGRATLFAAALDSPENLKRRLKTMTFRKNKMLRHAGTAAIAATLVVGLPLTATKAIEYVEAPVAPAAPSAPSAPSVAAIAPAAPQAPAAPLAAAAPQVPITPSIPLLRANAPTLLANVAPRAPRPPMPPRFARNSFAAPSAPRAPMPLLSSATAHPHSNTFTFSKEGKKWEDLTPEEKAEVRAELREAREELREALDEMRSERGNMRVEMRKEMKVDREEMRREMRAAREEIRQEIRNIERDREKIRANGDDPEIILLSLNTALNTLDPETIDATINAAMNSVDWKEIDRSMEAAEKSIEMSIRKIDKQIARTD